MYGNNLVTTKKHSGINDETIVKRHIRSDPEYHFWSDSKKSEFAKPENAFKEIPINFMHIFYDLEIHKDFWVPSCCLEEYIYDEKAAEKIVLPEDHRELINILTEEEDVLIEDVIEGKSGGNIVLLQGETGLLDLKQKMSKSKSH